MPMTGGSTGLPRTVKWTALGLSPIIAYYCLLLRFLWFERKCQCVPECLIMNDVKTWPWDFPCDFPLTPNFPELKSDRVWPHWFVDLYILGLYIVFRTCTKVQYSCKAYSDKVQIVGDLEPAFFNSLLWERYYYETNHISSSFYLTLLYSSTVYHAWPNHFRPKHWPKRQHFHKFEFCESDSKFWTIK